jgi:hypothetical protein
MPALTGRSSVLRRRAIAGLLAGLLSTAAAAQQQTPQAFLESIYQPYRQKGFKGQPYWELDRFFAPDLARTIERDMREAKRRGEVPTLDGDPFVDAQEWEVTTLSIASAVSGSNATGAVSFLNFGKPTALAIILVQTPRGWRIADIVGANGSLSGLFKKK